MKYIVVFMCLLFVCSSCIEGLEEEDVQYTVRGRMTYYNKPFDDVRLEFYKEVTINTSLSYQYMGETKSEPDGFFIFDYLGPSYDYGNMRVVVLNDSGEIRTFKRLSYAKSWTQNLNLADSTKTVLIFSSNNPLKVGDTLHLKMGSFQLNYTGPLANGTKDTITLKNEEGKLTFTTDPTDPSKSKFVYFYPVDPPLMSSVSIFYNNNP